MFSSLPSANFSFYELSIKSRSLHQLKCRLFISLFFFHRGHCLQFHCGEDDAYLELISHSFSLEISIITEPPTEKRLSKKARHLSTHRVLGANREKNMHTSSKTLPNVISYLIPVVTGTLNQ